MRRHPPGVSAEYAPVWLPPIPTAPRGVFVRGDGSRGVASMIVDNLRPAMEVFAFARKEQFTRVVNFGTTCAYSPECPVPFNPRDYLRGEPEPTNGAYAMAKRAIYEMSRSYSKQYGMQNLYIVMPNLYGPGDRWFDEDAHVIPSMIRKFHDAAVEGRSCVLYGTGKAEREFLFVEDAAWTIRKMVNEIYTDDPVHLSTGDTILVRDLAELIAKEIG